MELWRGSQQLAVFLALLPVLLAFRALHGERQARRHASLGLGAAANEVGSGRQAVLVSYRGGRRDAALEELAKSLKCSVSYVSSLSECEAKRNEASSTLLALDASRFSTQGELEALRKSSNAIFVIHEDLDAGLLDGGARGACLYDLYASTDAASNAKRLRKLLSCLNAAAPPSTEEMLLDAGEWSHFVSLTFPSIDAAVEKLPLLRIGADAWELRVDLLADQSVSSLHRQIALLRDKCPLPVVFTVRSEGQIGKFPKDPERIFELLREGLRAGVEWVDVEACWPADQTKAFTSLAAQYSKTSRLLGSLHVTVPQTRGEIDGLFAATDLGGAADMLKTVTGAANDEDCRRIHESGAAQSKPYIGVCLGAAGSYSRVLNRRFTPVTHECMAVAAPGQLTVTQLMERRIADGLIKPREHFLFGTPIQQSLSPSMHNSAFKALSLPHVYGLNEQTDVAAYKTVIRDSAAFGGASVTIPHKESIMPMLDEVRGAAKDIGAVNTIVVEDKGGRRHLVGYNTDWIGIQRPVRAKLQASGQPLSGAGLVVGAGGTARAACYALKSLGLKLYVSNRSAEKGRELAERFGGTFVPTEELDAITGLRAVVSTVPFAAGFTLPAALLQQRPVILDVVYKPAKTALMQQALDNNCPLVQGATMLLTQGLEQFELWNKRRAPFVEMDAAIFAGVERLDV